MDKPKVGKHVHVYLLFLYGKSKD